MICETIYILTLIYVDWTIDDSFQTSALQSNPSVTRIPAMALPLQEGPETCSRNVNRTLIVICNIERFGANII